MNRYLISFLILIFINTGSAFTNADLSILIKFQDKLEFLLNLNYKTIYKKYECSEKYTSKSRSEVEKEDPICFAHLNDIFGIGRVQLKKMRIARALGSSPISFFLDLGKDQYYSIPEKAYLQRNIRHEIMDIKASDFNFQSLTVEKLTLDEIAEAKIRFSNFLLNSLKNFIELPEFKSNLNIVTESEKIDLINRFSQIVLTPKPKRQFSSSVQKITFENLINHFNNYFEAQYQFKFRIMVKEEYENILTQFPYLSLVSGPTKMKDEIPEVFKKMINYSYLTLNEIQSQQNNITYKSIKTKFLKDNNSLTIQERNYLVKQLKINFSFEKVSEYFSNDIDNVEEQKAFLEQLTSYKKKETIKHFVQAGFLLTTTTLCLLPIGQSSGTILKIFNFARTGTAKIACSVALLTPISIFYLISNQEKYERAYQLFYSRGDNQGLFMEYNKLTQIQQSYLLDLILSPLNLMVISDAVKASNSFTSYFKQLFVEQLN